MRLSPLTVQGPDDSAKGSIQVICKGTGKRLPWNAAARAGWVADLNGPAFSAYYSPEAIKAGKLPPETMNDDHDRPCTEIRVLPVGGGGNALVGLASYRQEIAFRKERNRELGDAERFDLPSWDSLRVYWTAAGGLNEQQEGGK